MSCIALSARQINYMVRLQERMLEPFDHYTWDCDSKMNTYCVSPGKNICI